MSATPERRKPATGSRPARLGRALAVAAALFASALVREASADPPLFAFVQLSDVQAVEPVHFARFDLVLDAIVGAGQPGALLPHPVAFAVIAGDHVDAPKNLSEWTVYRDSLDEHLADAGIPWLAVPGNHDQDEYGTLRYEEYLADAGVWDASSAELRGHDGLVAATGWSGLRFVGVNSSYLAWNQVRAADLEQVKAIAGAAAAAGENVLLVSHHPHDELGRTPLAEVLALPGVVGYLRGHSGAPHATPGLAGVANAQVWDLSSESVMRDAALIYYEAFPSELRAYVLKLAESPAALPAPAVLPLVHPLLPAPAPVAPLAAFAAAPTTGGAPLEVAFSDLSQGLPTSWLWDFGDGTGSTERHPVHVYAGAGVYDVTLTVANASGFDTHAGSAAVEVSPPPPQLVFAPVADARVSETQPSLNFGSSTTLRGRLADGGGFRSYLRFTVSGLGGQRVARAELRLFVTDPSDSGGRVAPAAGGWSEGGITWENAPGLGPEVLDAAGISLPDSWVAFDVSGLVQGEGTYELGLASDSTNSILYSSREGSHPPQLVVFTAPPVPSLGAGGAAAAAALLGALGVNAARRLAPRRAPRSSCPGPSRGRAPGPPR